MFKNGAVLFKESCDEMYNMLVVKNILNSFSGLCFFFLLFLPFCLKAQPTFKAKVEGHSQEPVPMAVVAVLDANNNEISSAVTDSLGKFAISMPADVQNKWLYVQAFGYVALREPLQTALHRTVFEIVPDAVMLQDVTIQSNQLSVERSASCYTISNIYTSPIAAGNNIVEVLKYAPLVNVSTSGDLEILNKGKATIYVNGRKSNLDPKNIPAENIEKIEVITSPGSEYPSIDRNGILNIVLRKAPGDGVLGNITIGDSQKEKGELNAPDLNVFLSIQKKKVNASINFGADYYPSCLKEEGVYEYRTSNQLVKNNISTSERSLEEYMQVLLDWNVKPNQVLGFQVGGTLYHPLKDQTMTESQYANLESGQIDSMDITVRDLQAKTQYMLFGNINYSLKINDKQKLSLDMFYTHRMQDNPYYYQYRKLSIEESFLSEYLSQSRSEIDALDFKAKYEYQINDKIFFKAGFDCYGALVDDNFFYGTKVGSEYLSDTLQSNQFDFKDITSALYANIDWEISSKFSLSAGLRGEYYGYKGTQSVTNEIVSDKMPNLFPSLSLIYYAGDNHEFVLDFTSRLHVPGYSQRNPFKTYYSPSLYKANDISLHPCKSYDVNFEYTLFQDYRLDLSYSFTKDSWSTFYFPESDGVTRITELNFGNSHDFYGSVSVDKFLFHDYLMLSAQFDVMYDIYKVTSQQISSYNSHPKVSYIFDLSLSTALDKKQTWRLSTRFQYVSPFSGVGMNNSDNYYLSADVSKLFKNCALAFGVDDILDWQTKIYLNTDVYSYVQNRTLYCRTYWVRFNVKFGNKKTNGVQKRSSTIQGRL